MRLSVKTIIVGLALLLVLSALIVPAGAQDVPCPQIVSTALQQVSQDCDATGRNQACYGNKLVQANAQPGVSDFQFSAPGDLANVGDIQTMQLTALNTADSTWGVALMRIQANLPDTLPGQNVTLLLFGDVQIENASVSFAPSNTQGLTPEAAATPESTAEYNPMQAFLVKTGLTQPACAEAPADGILIQTPQDAAQKVVLMIDGAQVQLGSTVYIESHAGDEMEISTLEGEATITAFGQSQTAVTGMKIGVPIDDQLNASGPPTAPEAADLGLLLVLPVQALPQPIFTAQSAAPVGSPGTWLMTWGVAGGSCNVPFVAPPQTATMAVDESGNTVTLSARGQTSLVFTNDGTGSYSGQTPTGVMSFRFTSATQAEGELQGPGDGGCTLILPVTLSRQGD